MVMRQMRQNTKIIMILVAFAFVALMVFEWGMDMSGRSMGGDLGRVGRTPVPVQAYQNVYQTLYDEVARSQSGPISTAQNREIEDMAWNEVVNDILIRNELERRGIRVSDEEILARAQNDPPPQFRSDPAFQNAAGQFDLALYRQYISQQAQNPGFLLSLEDYYRQTIPREKLAFQVTAGIFVSDRELWERWKASRESVEVTALLIDPATHVPDAAVTVTEEEISRYYRANADEFAVPGRAQVRYTFLDIRPTAADTTAARDRILSLREEILGGTPFAEVAERESDDVGSAMSGGDMGSWAPGELLPQLDSAAFSLPVGEVSEPVLSTAGYHLLEVISREEDRAELRHILIEVVRTDESEIALFTQADSLETLGERRSFAEAAAAFGLDVLTGEITEESATLAGVGNAAEGQDWIFLDEEGVGAVSPLFESPDAFYMLEIVSLAPAGTLTVAEASSRIEADIRAERKLELAMNEARGWATELRNGAISLEELAARLGRPVVHEGPFARTTIVPNLGQSTPAIGAAFGAPVGEIAGPAMAGNRIAILRVEARTEADREAWEAQKDVQRSEVTLQIEQERLGKWIEGLRETIRIVDNREAYFRAAEEMQANMPFGGLGY
jgi:parvulin-like peptidyl-prolyl isomerase